MIPKSAHLMSAPDRSAETGDGAWLWASGQPHVHRRQPRLRPVADEDEDEADPDDAGVELATRSATIAA